MEDKSEKILTVVPKDMEIVKPKEGKFTSDQRQALIDNLLKFTAPALAVFFGQMALGINWRASGIMALYILYAGFSDYFKKVNDDTAYLREK